MPDGIATALPLAEISTRDRSMGASPDEYEVGARVAAMLRLRRQQLGWTLTEAANRAGMSASQLSRMERAQHPISVVELVTFARLYGGKTSDYFLAEDTRPIKVTRFCERTRSIRNVTPAGNVIQEHLIGAVNIDIAAVMVFMPPKAGSGDALVHDGVEIVTVIDGSLVMWVGETMMELDRGDSVYYDCGIPHRWMNPEDRPASLLVIKRPGVGGQML